MAEKSETEEEERRSGGAARIKDEPMEADEECEPPAFGPAALGLHRVGTKLPPKPAPSEPVQKLNARGMPARIRKKNRFIFIDDFVNSSPPRQSPKRGPKSPSKTPSKQPNSAKKKSPGKTPRGSRQQEKNLNERNETPSRQSPDRKSGQKIGMRLRNLLKLPKAHKWVCFEYFYSDIDKTLFDGENDFMICLKESFPQLNSNKLTQKQWMKVRRMMGKPRRCSQAFFAEERKELERKRQLIRYIQQRKTTDINLKDMPNEIPMQLVVGSKVTARLRRPQDGLFTGSIDAVDTSNNTYRITFERPKLGTHSVPDYEVLSNEPPETIPIATILQKFRPRQVMEEFLNLYESRPLVNENYGDPLIGYNTAMNKLLDTTVGRFPLKLLELMVRVMKILNEKKTKLMKLKEYNSEAEKKKSFGERMTDDFQRRYAGLVIELERMNLDLQDYLNEVQVACLEIAPGPSVAAMLAPSHVRAKCQEEAADLVEKNHTGNIKDENVLGLITDLVALMLQVKCLSDSDQNAFELKGLHGTMEQIKLKLHPKHQLLFQNNVEIHMQQVQMGLSTANRYMAPTWTDT